MAKLSYFPRQRNGIINLFQEKVYDVHLLLWIIKMLLNAKHAVYFFTEPKAKIFLV